MDSDGPCSCDSNCDSSFDSKLEAGEFCTLGGIVHFWLTSHVEQAPCLVFLPGIAADRRLFDAQLQFFEGKYNCFVWDPPSHGQSRSFDLSWTLEDQARWLHEVLAEEGFAYPVLVGQGIGAHVAQVFMDMFPGEVPGFIALGATPLQSRFYSEHDLMRMRHTFAKFASIPRFLLYRRYVSGFAETSQAQEVAQGMVDSYSKKEFVRLIAHGCAQSADAIEQDRRYKIHCPAMIICGTRDGIASTKRLCRAWHEVTDIPVHWIGGAGHNVACDDPSKVNALIDEFVAGLKS